MDEKYNKLKKEYVNMNSEKSQEYADNNCFYCEKYVLNNGDGNKKCKFAPICDLDLNDLKEELEDDG